jgi:acyl phosphate:glycerol-3-phosphate acyltransferase
MTEFSINGIAIIMGYAFGSIPFGLIFAKLLGHGDIRKIGSGNIGATNALRTGSKKLAILTLLFDISKGIAPVIIARCFLPEATVIAGLGAILGHCFPIWLKFKGGKGVATTIGVILAISPLLGLAVIATWFAMAFTFKISSLAALVSVLLAPIYTYFIIDAKNALLVLLITAIVWIRHKDNIVRILKKEEKRIGEK